MPAGESEMKIAIYVTGFFAGINTIVISLALYMIPSTAFIEFNPLVCTFGLLIGLIASIGNLYLFLNSDGDKK